MAAKYQIVLMGGFRSSRPDVEPAILTQIDDLGIGQSNVEILEEPQIASSDPKAPLVAVFFGYVGVNDAGHPALDSLLRDSTAIIPCVHAGSPIGSSLPSKIRHINAFTLEKNDSSRERLATLILENLRLLRSERRLFISYRRSESQSVAIQLHESLDAAGFDVFLDTRSVPSGVDFQGILWHRMADSDVVVLLDTPDFRTGHWTQKELSQANTTNIQILHLLWPKVRPDESSAFSEFVPLKPADFHGRYRIGDKAHLTDVAARTIVAKAESLRARALAARHRSLVDNFCDRARDAGAKSVALQPERFISVVPAKGGKIAVVPTIGVPRADLYQRIESTIKRAMPDAKRIWLLYDERGILEDWLAHLAWLDGHLPIKSIQVSKCADHLGDLP